MAVGGNTTKFYSLEEKHEIVELEFDKENLTYSCDSGNTGTRFLTGGKNGSLFYFGNNKTLEWSSILIVIIYAWEHSKFNQPHRPPSAPPSKTSTMEVTSTSVTTLAQYTNSLFSRKSPFLPFSNSLPNAKTYSIPTLLLCGVIFSSSIVHHLSLVGNRAK